MNNYVSVIIPVYNDQSGIDSCLAALAVQSYPQKQYEVIVIDNASDPPISINPIYSNFTRLAVCHTQGSYAARNAGLAIGHGDILAFTDADCIPDRNWITTGVKAMIDNNYCFIIGGEIKFLLSKKPTAVERYQSIVGFMQRENIENRGFSATANLFATKTQFAKVGLYDEKLLSGGDRDWCWRAEKAGFFIKYTTEAIVHTLPRNSLSTAIRQVRRVAGGRFFLKRYSKQRADTLKGIKRHRSSWNSLNWLMTHPELSGWNLLKVLGVASLLKLAHFVETIRLHLSGSPERR